MPNSNFVFISYHVAVIASVRNFPISYHWIRISSLGMIYGENV